MKGYKVLSILLIILTVFSSTAVLSDASGYDYRLEAIRKSHGVYSVSGSILPKQKSLTLTVLYPNASIDGVTSLNAASSIYTIKQFSGDKPFEYTLKIADENPTGFYKIYLGGTDYDFESNELFTDVFFANTGFLSNALNEFNSVNANGLKSLLVKYSGEYPILRISTADIDTYLSIVQSSFSQTQNFANLSEIQDLYNKTVCVQILSNAASITDISSFIGGYAFTFDVDVNDDYAKVADGANKLFYEFVKLNRPYKSTSSIKNDLSAAIAIASINSETRQGVIEKSEKYADVLGLDLNGYYKNADKTELSKALHNKNFTSQIQVKNAFDAKLKDMQSVTKQPESIGGGGGGGSKVTFDPNAGTTVNDGQIVDFNISKRFEDTDLVPWAVEAIEGLRMRGIVNGDGSNNFMPFSLIKREEFVKMLLLTLNIDINYEKESDFKDTDKNDWHFKYISCAAEKGIISGYSQYVFGTGNLITRQEMAVMLYRAIMSTDSYLDMELGDVAISDIEKIAPYAADSVKYLYGAQVIKGKYEGGAFAPDDFATRAETAQMLYNAVLKIKRR